MSLIWLLRRVQWKYRIEFSPTLEQSKSNHYDIVGSFQVFVLFNFILYEKQLHKDEPSMGNHFDFENGFIFTCFIRYLQMNYCFITQVK